MLPPQRTTMQIVCPPMTYYMGDLIYNKNDTARSALPLIDAMRCANLTPRADRSREAHGERRGEKFCGEWRPRYRIAPRYAARCGCQDGSHARAAHHRADFAGISSSSKTSRDEQTALIERAIHSNVVIGALDARGLYGDDRSAGRQSEPNVNPATITQKFPYRNAEAMMQSGRHGHSCRRHRRHFLPQLERLRRRHRAHGSARRNIFMYSAFRRSI